MAVNVSLAHTFAGLSGPIPLSYLDANYTDLTDALADFNTFSNYLVDTGATNAYAASLGAGLTGTLAAGLAVQLKITNTNTGASTFAFNGGAAKAIQNAGGALTGGELVSGQIYFLQYDGTQWQLLTILPARGTVVGTFTFDGSGGSSSSITMTWMKIDQFVWLNIPILTATTGTGSVSLTSNSAIDTMARPAHDQYIPIARVVNNGATINGGAVHINTDGTVAILRDGIGTAFTNTATGGTDKVLSVGFSIL